MGEQWWPCIYIYIHVYIYIYIISLKKTSKVYHFKSFIATNNLKYIYIHIWISTHNHIVTFINMLSALDSALLFLATAVLHRWPRWKHGQDITAAYCSLWTASSSWCVPRMVSVASPNGNPPFLENRWCFWGHPPWILSQYGGQAMTCGTTDGLKLMPCWLAKFFQVVVWLKMWNHPQSEKSPK